jgi:transcriptional regulator with XRE-family HTH domain
MQLRTYLDEKGISPAAFAAQIPVSGAALYRYMAGERIPRRAILERITHLTRGAVSASDFYAGVVVGTQTDEAAD